MNKTTGFVITGTNSITAIGRDGEMTADSVFSGNARIAYDETREDEKGKPIKTSVIIEGLVDKDHDEAAFMAQIAKKCLVDLCERYFEEGSKVNDLFLFLGFPSTHRPGPSFEGDDEKWVRLLKNELGFHAENVHCQFFPSGNVSAFHGIQKAENALLKYPGAVCIVGGVDSLLSIDTLAWLEKDWRLVSETSGRQHGFFPSQAAGFFIVETKKAAMKRKKQALAEIAGHAITSDPAPFVSEYPCKGDGLTQAIRKALADKNTLPTAIDAVFCDLNGEYYRFKEWGFADVRCFPENTPRVVHPADCMGDVGAAWLPVLTGIASAGFKKDTVGQTVMIFCSDDHGERGAMILKKP